MLTTKYARGKIIIIYQRTCSAQAIEAGYDSNEFHPAFLDKLWQNQMIISKNPQFTGISARQQLEFTTHLLLTD